MRYVVHKYLLPLCRLVAFSFCSLFPLLCRSFLVWCSSICWFLLLLLVFWCHIQKNHCQDQCQGAFSLCFLLGVLWFYVSILNPFWVNFCEWCKRGFHFHSFAHEYPVFPTPFIEETVLSLLSILGSRVKCQLTGRAWIYFWALTSVPSVCVAVFLHDSLLSLATRHAPGDLLQSQLCHPHQGMKTSFNIHLSKAVSKVTLLGEERVRKREKKPVYFEGSHINC